MARPSAAIAALALLACRPAREPMDDHPPGRSDCGPWLANGCDDGDGCPDGPPDARPPPRTVPRPAIASTCGRAAPTDATVAEVARELHDKPALTKVLLVAPTGSCAAATRDAFGADAARVETAVHPDEAYVHFDVGAWEGRSCR